MTYLSRRTLAMVVATTASLVQAVPIPKGGGGTKTKTKTKTKTYTSYTSTGGSSHGKPMGKVAIIVICSIVGAIVLVVVAWSVWQCYRNRKIQEGKRKQVVFNHTGAGFSAVDTDDHEELLPPPSGKKSSGGKAKFAWPWKKSISFQKKPKEETGSSLPIFQALPDDEPPTPWSKAPLLPGGDYPASKVMMPSPAYEEHDSYGHGKAAY